MGTEPLVPSLRTCGAADKVHGAWVSRGAAGHGDRFATRHLRGEPKCQSSAPAAGPEPGASMTAWTKRSEGGGAMPSRVGVPRQ